MRILIVGAGVVGSHLAEHLSSEGHDIAIVDSNSARIRDLRDSARLDVLAVDGDACRLQTLTKAGLSRAEMLIAVTNSDEVNLVLAGIARHLGVAHRIVRMRNEEFDTGSWRPIADGLGVEKIINPDSLAAESLEAILDIPGSVDLARFHDGEILLVAFDIGADAPIVGRKLAELKRASALDGFLITHLIRGGSLVVPTGDDVIREGDRIYVIAHRDLLPFFLNLVHRHVDPVQRVVILGGTRMGVSLAQRLEGKVQHVTLIEPDPEAADRAAAVLSRATVLVGNGCESAVLDDAHADRADFYMALGPGEEANFLSALLARRRGAKRTAVLTQEPDYVPVLDALDVDIVVNPRLAAVGEILSYVRRGRIRNVAKLEVGGAEVLEMEAVDGSAAVRKPLSKLRFPPGTLVGAVVRRGDLMIPDGNSQIEPGDEVIVFALPERIPEVEKIFAHRRRLL